MTPTVLNFVSPFYINVLFRVFFFFVKLIPSVYLSPHHPYISRFTPMSLCMTDEEYPYDTIWQSQQ
jgi:hypothetical protein